MRASITTVPVRKFSADERGSSGHSSSGRQTGGSEESLDFGTSETNLDFVSVEEPLQIRITDITGAHNAAITMRTPGHDRELAAGFLFTEGILTDAGQIAAVTEDERGAIDVTLTDSITCELGNRNFYVTSSCGVCGKASLDALRQSGARMITGNTPRVDHNLLFSLPGKLRDAQAVFEHTGGLHAAGLFTATGDLVSIREDVGRHNAVDKLIGQAFLDRLLPLDKNILMLSGRVSFELVQKAVMAGIPIMAAVGAPSSLAVETALRFGITLIGFLRDGRCNVYSGADRLLP